MTSEVCARDGRPVEVVVEEMRNRYLKEILVARKGKVLVIQAPSWLVNDTLDLKDFVDEYLQDEFVFSMEYGGEFAEVVDAWINDELVDRCYMEKMPTSPRRSKILAMDPGLKHSRYGLAMGYRIKDEYYIDHVMWWQGTQRQPVDIETIEDYVLEVLDPANRIVKAVLDQHQSASTIQKFNKSGLKCEETFFTVVRNLLIYSELRKAIVSGKFHTNSRELLNEIKHLQRVESGARFKVLASPGHTDDLADCAANCVYELSIMKTGKLVL